MTTDMVIFLDFELRRPCRIRPGRKRLLGGPALFLIRGTANNGPGCRNIKKLGADIFFRSATRVGFLVACSARKNERSGGLENDPKRIFLPLNFPPVRPMKEWGSVPILTMPDLSLSGLASGLDLKSLV